jgi:toxin ParE1/3/4
VEVIWTRDALRDIDRAYRYIAEHNPVAARRVADALLAAGDSLSEMPRRGRPGLQAGTRELVSEYPYVIVYRVDDAVRIIRVWHGAQKR